MSSQTFFVNDKGPLSANVYDADGVTPVTPASATIDVVNQHTGVQVVNGGACSVDVGLASYLVTPAVTATAGRYVGYMRVVIDGNEERTIPLYFDVLDKGSYLIVDIWRRKVLLSAPNGDAISDDAARDWIDQAVSHITRHYFDIGSSILASISPAPSAGDRELIAQVASLMARSSWYAGKGNWSDEEMRFSAEPFIEEWRFLQRLLTRRAEEALFVSYEDFNRDRVVYDGIKLDSPDYWWKPAGAPETGTDIPI